MSELTKEWLQQKIADMEAIRDDIPFGLGEDGTNILAALRIALASLEAEAVCVIDQSNLDYLKSGSDADVWPASRAEMGDVLLYRSATPAPVSVPAAMEMDDDFDSAFEHGKAVGWNACRAAMLQGAEPVTTANKLPECWVACSERMPDDEEDVLCFGQYGDNDIDEERYQFMGWLSSKGIKRVWRVSDGDSQNRRARVTHWMPLPAAPQREGENV
ncbi:DUF551 domain-containing protein [Citrobacter portucalensis]